MAEPDEDFSEEDYVDFLEDQLTLHWDVISNVQEFFVYFLELLEFLGDKSENSPVKIPLDVHKDIFESLIDKCTKSLEDFEEKQGKLINLED